MLAGKDLVESDSQRENVGLNGWLPLTKNQFWCHVGQGAPYGANCNRLAHGEVDLRSISNSTPQNWREPRHSKVGNARPVVFIEEDIPWLYVLVDHLTDVARMLQAVNKACCEVYELGGWPASCI